MTETQPATIFLLENGVTQSSIAFGWSLSEDLPKSIKVSRLYPTQQLLLDLTPEQFTTLTTYQDSGLFSQTFHSYLVSYAYEDKEQFISLDTRTLAPEIAGITVKATNCHTIYCSWSGNNVKAHRTNSDGTNWVNAPNGPHSNSQNDCGVGSTHWTDCTVNSSVTYTYHVPGQDSPPISPKSCNSRSVSGFMNPRYNVVAGDQGNPPVLDPDHGTYELVVPQDHDIKHYSRIPGESNWRLVDILTLPQSDYVQDSGLSLVQNFHHPELLEMIAEVASAQGDYLAAYEFKWGLGQSSPFRLDTQFGPIERITGAPALIQSDQGYFEVFVPNSSTILHFSYQQDQLQGARGQLVNVLKLPTPDLQVTSVATTQSTTGRITVIARTASTLSKNGDTLFAFEFTPTSIQQEFMPVYPVPAIANGAPIDQVVGNPALLYSTEMKAFELLVPRLQGGRAQMDYYTLNQDTIQDATWHFVATLAPQDDTQPAAVSMVRSFTPGQLEALARVSPPIGNDYLLRYTFSQQTGWGAPSIITSDGQPINAGTITNNPPTIGPSNPIQ